MYLHVTWTWSA